MLEIKYLQVLVMPNDEVIYRGRTLGFLSDEEKGKTFILRSDLRVSSVK
jgi:hypothetical protein